MVKASASGWHHTAKRPGDALWWSRRRGESPLSWPLIDMDALLDVSAEADGSHSESISRHAKSLYWWSTSHAISIRIGREGPPTALVQEKR